GLSVVSIFLGVSDLSPLDLVDLTDEETEVLLISRLPRLISIVIAGASMSIAGLIMQQLSKNKFVSPTTAGTLDSAKFGVLISLMLSTDASSIQMILVSFAFALLGTYLFMKILDNVRFIDPVFIPLVGLMFGNIINSMGTFFAYKDDLIQNMTSWMQGDFSMIISGNYELLYISIPTLILAYFYANNFIIAVMVDEFSIFLV